METTKQPQIGDVVSYRVNGECTRIGRVVDTNSTRCRVAWIERVFNGQSHVEIESSKQKRTWVQTKKLVVIGFTAKAA